MKYVITKSMTYQDEWHEGWFKMPKKFLRQYVHKYKLTVYDYAIYSVLCCYRDPNKGTCFIGIRKIASLLNISKTTVFESIKVLVACRLVVRLPSSRGMVSLLMIHAVPVEASQPYHPVIPKEITKEILMKSHSQTAYTKRNLREVMLEARESVKTKLP